ncbi:hypothetical protein PPROV_000241200 [Pycnococcus provasolii]|uniref:Uncharacterized protein n=1 Tax=Pycnococcus provasolii TaxID=41880 RepID=A0A830HEX4_9CHLO|nr:hypothetical protein PPROV_000241200 [Pycnococcus provasolii]
MPAGSAMNLSPVNMPSLLKPPSAALLKTHSANATSHRKAFRPLTDYFSNQSRTASSSAKKHTKRNVHVYSDDSDVSLRSSLDYASHEVETDEEEEHLDGQDEEEECVSLGVGVGGAVVGVGIVVGVGVGVGGPPGHGARIWHLTLNPALTTEKSVVKIMRSYVEAGI